VLDKQCGVPYPLIYTAYLHRKVAHKGPNLDPDVQLVWSDGTPPLTAHKHTSSVFRGWHSPVVRGRIRKNDHVRAANGPMHGQSFKLRIYDDTRLRIGPHRIHVRVWSMFRRFSQSFGPIAVLVGFASAFSVSEHADHPCAA
jgi:hypothetical protein